MCAHSSKLDSVAKNGSPVPKVSPHCNGATLLSQNVRFQVLVFKTEFARQVEYKSFMNVKKVTIFVYFRLALQKPRT